MSDTPDERMIEGRTELLPEEKAVGSDDAEAQAEAILAESEDRTLHPEKTRHEYEQTPDEIETGADQHPASPGPGSP